MWIISPQGHPNSKGQPTLELMFANQQMLTITKVGTRVSHGSGGYIGSGGDSVRRPWTGMAGHPF